MFYRDLNLIQNHSQLFSCLLVTNRVLILPLTGSRYGRRSNWFKIHCLIQDSTLVGINDRIGTDGQTLLPSLGNDNQMSGNSNNTGSAAGTPSPSGQNSNNSSQNNGIINSSNNGSDLLSQHYKSLVDAELNNSSNSNKLLTKGAGHLPYNLLDVAKTFKKQNGNSNSNGNSNYLPDTDTTQLQAKLGSKFNKSLSSHLPLSPGSPLLQSPLFARNLTNNIATTSAAQQLLGNAQTNSQLATQNLLSNALFNPNPLYQNLAAANLLPLQPLLQNQNNTVNNLNLTSALNSLNSLNARNQTNAAQQILQQQFLQQFSLAGLNKLFDGGNNEKPKKNGPARTFNEQETPIDLSVKQPGGLDPATLAQVYASLLKNVDDQSTFSPSSSNEENFGLTGGLPIDQLNNPSTLVTLMQLSGKANLLSNNSLLNNLNLNLSNLNSLNSLAGLGSLGTGNLTDNLNAMNLLNLNNLNSLNNPTSNTETKEEPFDNSEEDTAEDAEEDMNNKLQNLQQTLNQLNSTNLLSQLNPLNLDGGRNDLTSLLSQQMLIDQLKLQNSNASKLTNSQSLDLLRKFDSNSNVQKQALNKSTSLAQNSLNSLNSLSSSTNKLQRRKQQVELPVRATKQIQSRELVKDKNNNEDELNEEEEQLNEASNSEVISEKNKLEETRPEEDDCQEVSAESAASEECTEQPIQSPRNSRKASVEREENDGEDEMSEDEQALNKLNESKRRRRKRSASAMQGKEDYEDELHDEETSKRMKKEHHTDSEPETSEAT